MHGDSVRLSDHARERCAQMQVRTGVVKRIVRRHDLSWLSERRVGTGYLVVAASSAFPTIAVVYAADQNPPMVITVLWRTPEHYDRDTYRPLGDLTS